VARPSSVDAAEVGRSADDSVVISVTRDVTIVATSQVDALGRDPGRRRGKDGAPPGGQPGAGSRLSFSHPDCHRRLPARDPPAPRGAATGRGLVPSTPHQAGLWTDHRSGVSPDPEVEAWCSLATDSSAWPPKASTLPPVLTL